MEAPDPRADGPRPSEAEGTDATENAREELERLRRDLEDERERALRLRADFENHRRRTAGAQESGQREGRRAAVLKVLPVVDALEKALSTSSSDPQFYAGVEAILRLFLDALKKAGVEPIESAGQPYDPELHEAVATAPGEPGTVVRELRRGWRLDGELLRPAQVVVAQTPEATPTWP